MNGVPEGSEEKSEFGGDPEYTTPFNAIMHDLQDVCEGQPMPALTQKIISVMPKDKEQADVFVSQLRRLKEAGERAYQEGLQAYFALVRQ